MNFNYKAIILWVALAAVGVILFAAFKPGGDKEVPIPVSEFLRSRGSRTSI